MVTNVLLFGLVGGPELIVVLAIAVLLFGANKLPELARSSGQALGEFKKGRMDIEAEIRKAAEPDPMSRDDEGSESAATETTVAETA
ncbi:MAG: twin-arginine translocase TatA/TatE family subunit [Halorientalis sp.]